MNTLRNTLKQQFSQVPNEMITDLTMSAGELRVLLYLYTKPDDWNVYNKDICKQLDISEKTLTRYWKSLLTTKWLRREQSRDSKGNLQGGYLYRIGEFDRIGQNTVSDKCSDTDKSGGHSNTKPINKHLTYTNTKVASHLASRIAEVKPNFKTPNLDAWSKDVDLAIRVDGRTEAELIGCIDWIYKGGGSFWIPNILSCKKLREKFDTMELQMMSKKGNSNGLDAMLEVYNAS